MERRMTYPVRSAEVLENARQETELHAHHHERANWMAWMASGLGVLVLLFSILAAFFAVKYVSVKDTQDVRILNFDPSGQAHTWSEGTTGFDAANEIVRNSMRYYLRTWAEGWFSRLRDPSLGPEVKDAHMKAYMFLSGPLNAKLWAEEERDKTIETFLASGAEQFRAEARPELVTVTQEQRDGAAKGEARIHMTFKFYDASGTPTAQRSYVTVAHFRVDPAFLAKLKTLNQRQAEDIAAYNPIVLTVESFTQPEQE